MPARYTPEQRIAAFWDKVNKTDGCWLWTGATDTWGYGSTRFIDRTRHAYRVAYELANGPVPDGYDVDHICHVRLCVNPSHLRAITHKQNLENRAGATKASKSGIRGVSPWPHSESGKWRATVNHNQKQVHVGVYSNVADAEAAVIAKRLELFTCNDADRAA